MAKKIKTIKEVVESHAKAFVRDKWADYADEKLVPKFNVCRFDDKADNRFYYFTDGDELVIASGATDPFGRVSIERDGIERWKESHPDWRHLLNVSSDYGTLEHILFGGIGLGNGINKVVLDGMQKIALDNNKSGEMPARDTLAFLKFQEDYTPTPLLIEGQLVWKDPDTGERLAMTVDMLTQLNIVEVTKQMVEDGVWQRGERKGQPKFVEQKIETPKTIIALIDFKSNFFEKEKKSFYEVNMMQLMAGKLAVEQNFGITVDGIYNFACNNWRVAPSYTLYEHKLTEKDWQVFRGYWLTIIAHDLHKPKGGFLMTDKFANSSDYKILSYKEYVEQVLLNSK